MWLLEKDKLESVLAAWHAHHEVYIPSRSYGESVLLPFEEGALDLNYINFSQPIKEFLFKGREVLFRWEMSEGDINFHMADPKEGTQVLFGLRSCDINGIEYMDRFYEGEYCDGVYKENRARTLLVALNCVDAGERCFCDSVSAGPFVKSGYDLLFTPIDDMYLIESGSDKGEMLIGQVASYLKPASQADLEEKDSIEVDVKSLFTNVMWPKDPKAILAESFDNAIWDELAAKCIRCGGCTNVCPTCTCYNVVEEKTSETEGTRIRSWDSCQSCSFTKNAGDHRPRSPVSRVRYRIYDKLAYIEERFGHKGCTGCGRCIDTCPVDIDIVDIINRLDLERTEATPSRGEVETGHKPVFDMNAVVAPNNNFHQSCETTYMPQVAVITDIVDETRNIKRFYLKYENKALHDNFEFRGQFFEITVFGVGEIAISIPFASEQREVFDFCVKKTGKVTGVLHDMKVGDKVGLRGPFGKGFPMSDMEGRDLLIIGSGVGVAPIRTAVLQALENRKAYGKIVVIGSAMTYEDLIYKEDFIKWAQEGGIEVAYAFTKATDLVPATVGRINDLLPNLSNDWNNTSAIICASPNRIRLVAKDLMDLGMDNREIYTSLETHMRCGLGKCGHCKVGDKYMCVDGPVFNYEEMLKLPPEF